MSHSKPQKRPRTPDLRKGERGFANVQKLEYNYIDLRFDTLLEELFAYCSGRWGQRTFISHGSNRGGLPPTDWTT